MSIDTRVIRSEPHVEIGTLIQRDANLLVERWCDRAIAEQPSARRVHADILRDQFPSFLRDMGRDLRRADNPDPPQHVDSAHEHGAQRWDNGWSLSELARDYQLLQLVILEYLEGTLDRPLRYREVMAVGVFIDDAIAASIATYVKNRDDDVRKLEFDRVAALQAADRRKDEFLATLAHELRNPLAPIANSVQILQMLLPGADPKISQPIDVVDRQTRQLSRLVDDLLDLSRIAQGRFELRTQPTDLTSVLEQAIQTCEPIIKIREHRLTVELPSEPIAFEADAARLVQVVVNLLNNAAKYTNRGGQIWLEAHRDGETAVIRVRDNGLGLAPEMVARIFELYVQVEGSLQHSQGGLGIGLTLVRRLVELHGGTIECRSEGLHRGSEFVVRIPIRHAAMTASAAGLQPAAAPLASWHLLIIEDNDDSRESLGMLLELLGHRVELAENGSQGIAMATATEPRIALVDIGLPDMSGYEVARHLRTTFGDRIYLIALTGYSQSDDKKKSHEAGFDAHLVKPASVDELTRILVTVAGQPS